MTNTNYVEMMHRSRIEYDHSYNIEKNTMPKVGKQSNHLSGNHIGGNHNGGNHIGGNHIGGNHLGMDRQPIGPDFSQFSNKFIGKPGQIYDEITMFNNNSQNGQYVYRSRSK